MGGLPGDLGIAGRLLGFRSGIAGGLLGGLMGDAGQPGSLALGSARIASDVDRFFWHPASVSASRRARF